MVGQARSELPNECCGLLAGRYDEGPAGLVGRVLRRYPLVNAAQSPRQFASEPYSMFAAVKAMRKHHLEILAVYHSHPTSAPIPSRTDLAQSFSPDVMNLIISLRTPAPVLRGWWLADAGFTEAEVRWLTPHGLTAVARTRRYSRHGTALRHLR
jgi:proteasome lid subunit RPN8/RPN11